MKEKVFEQNADRDNTIPFFPFSFDSKFGRSAFLFRFHRRLFSDSTGPRANRDA